jgi:hypothetical protein
VAAGTPDPMSAEAAGTSLDSVAPRREPRVMKPANWRLMLGWLEPGDEGYAEAFMKTVREHGRTITLVGRNSPPFSRDHLRTTVRRLHEFKRTLEDRQAALDGWFRSGILKADDVWEADQLITCDARMLDAMIAETLGLLDTFRDRLCAFATQEAVSAEALRDGLQAHDNDLYHAVKRFHRRMQTKTRRLSHAELQEALDDIAAFDPILVLARRLLKRGKLTGDAHRSADIKALLTRIKAGHTRLRNAVARAQWHTWQAKAASWQGKRF